jgi:DNA polymerase eta
MPMESVPDFFNGMPIGKVRNLGGKLGDEVMDTLKCKTMGDLARIPLKTLLSRFDEKTA